jgi:hypothetical protein
VSSVVADLRSMGFAPMRQIEHAGRNSLKWDRLDRR